MKTSRDVNRLTHAFEPLTNNNRPESPQING
jgi:hypothetical protein